MRRFWVMPLLCLAVLAPIASPAGAASKKPAASFKCPKGYKKVKKTVTRHGKKKAVFHCRKQPAPPPLVPVAPAPAPAPAAVKLPSTTTLGAVYQDLPPARLSSSNIEFKIGEYTLSGAVSPFAVPDLRCNGLAGCVEPAGSLQGGSLTVPVLARLEYGKNLTAGWSLGIPPPAGAPSWFKLAEASTGAHFFQATGAPDPAAFLPSTARAPIQLAGPHLPGTPRHEGALDATVGETFPSFPGFATVGGYTKLGGPEYDLIIESTESLSSSSATSGCKFQIRANGVAESPAGEWSSGYYETVIAGLSKGAKQIEIYARHEGSTANCGLSAQDTYVVTEKLHS